MGGVGVGGAQGAAGALDPSFGDAGKVLTAFASSRSGGVTGVAVQADGRIIVAGYAAERGYTGVNIEPDDESAWALVRYTRNGELDTTFSTWALESHRLGEDGELRLGALNFAVSLVLGLLAAWAGRHVGAAL